jgi:hypothetical protein
LKNEPGEAVAKGGSRTYPTFLEPDQLERLNRQHVQGAHVRIGASLGMWCVALLAFFVGDLKSENLLGITASVAFVILINPPTLWILKRIRRRSRYQVFSILI